MDKEDISILVDRALRLLGVTTTTKTFLLNPVKLQICHPTTQVINPIRKINHNNSQITSIMLIKPLTGYVGKKANHQAITC